ncbi:serine hydrolase [Luteimonas sp. SJ-92]|uniref:Serine hydrolase n=1 Tax=Luteimonas salinisoli TaxID=2752307 RepID=A0A853J6S3_9GAMM|nr:serine hydrolase domain-containing protein [Luteimonas salinisoli]NZA24796.1 serine hydrolase [Luteimonas salinisoli]
MRVSTILSLVAGMLLALPLAAAPAASPTSIVPPELAPKTGEPDAEDAGAEADATVQAGPANLTRQDLEAWLDGYMPYALQTGDIAGAVVVVVKDGQVLLQKGYGYADLATRTPVDPARHLFRPGSISKLFTWTAVMQLVEQGKLDLDADLNQYIDFEVPARDGKPATLRQVMTHTVGFEEQIRGLITSNADQIVPLEQALKRWVPERIHAPGTTPAYSNYATALAGYIIERVSGESFYDYIDRHILAPLDMEDSSFRQPLPDALLANMSKGYESASDGKPRDYEFISLAPAGSLAATGADMAKFMIAHLQGGTYGDARILREDTAKTMHTTGQTSVGALNRMMLGFYETSLNGHRAISHGGDTLWFHSDLQLFIDDGIGIYVSMNSSGRNGAPLQIRDNLAEGFADRYLPGPEAPVSAVSEADAKLHAAQIAGAYTSSRRPDSNFMSLLNLLGPVKVFANEDGTISVSIALDASGAPTKWREISPYLWQDVASGDRLAADVVDGKVTRFSMEPYAAIMVFQRLPWWKSPGLLLTLLAASLLALAATVVAWPVSALVRRYYGVPYGLSGDDARMHRIVRIAALAVLVVMAGALGLIVGMMSDLEKLSADTDAVFNLMRLLALVVLPLGALAALWNCWKVLRGRRRLLAKLWSIVLALSCVFLLWIGISHHLLGYGAYY